MKHHFSLRCVQFFKCKCASMQNHNLRFISSYWSGIDETRENQFLNEKLLLEKLLILKLNHHKMEKRGVCWHCMSQLRNHWLQSTIQSYGCPIQIFTIFEDNFQLFSYILCILKKKLGQWSLETFESAATKKHYLAKAKISFRFKQVFYYFV